MRKLFAFALIATSFLLASCGSSISNNISTPSSGSAPVSLTMTDDPPAGVSVLFFQVSLTGAALSPAAGTGPTISLLPNNSPIQIDVTNLQALAAFLGGANVPAGTYGSLSLTFADPKLVIFNASDTALGSSCAVGAVCTLTPAIDNSATVDFSSSPFPVTISGSTPLGFLIDFHLNTIIQSDLSVNLGVANGVTVSQVPPNATGAAPPFGFVTGIVGSVSGNQFTMATAWGKTFTVDVDSNTVYVDWPPCASPGALSCLTAGAYVSVQVSKVETDGSLLAAMLTYLQSASQQTVQGTVIGYTSTQITLLLDASPTASSALPMGGLATVTIAGSASFSVDANGFSIPSGMVFAGISNLTNGQELNVDVVPGTLTGPSGGPNPGGWGPPPSLSFTTDKIQLEPGQISGSIAAVASPAFTLTYLFKPVCFNVCPTYVALLQIPVETTSQTVYAGFNPDNFSGLAKGDLVSVNGWLFEGDNGLLDTAVTTPEILAETVVLHPSGNI